MNQDIIHHQELSRQLNFMYDSANMNFTRQKDRRIQLYKHAIDQLKKELIINQNYKILRKQSKPALNLN